MLQANIGLPVAFSFTVPSRIHVAISYFFHGFMLKNHFFFLFGFTELFSLITLIHIIVVQSLFLNSNYDLVFLLLAVNTEFFISHSYLIYKQILNFR
jgi:hypothetical protein